MAYKYIKKQMRMKIVYKPYDNFKEDLSMKINTDLWYFIGNPFAGI